MATVTLKDVRKVYPFNGDDAKKIKKGEPLKTNLTVLPDGLLAVHDFNLDIKDKEFIVLVGPSGCGKTTLLNIIGGTMSIIGPRPESIDIVENFYSEEQKRTLHMLPGLASPGSVFNYTHSDKYLGEENAEEDYVKNLMPVKLAPATTPKSPALRVCELQKVITQSAMTVKILFMISY